MPLDPEIQALLAAMASLNAPPLSQGTPEAARAGFRFMTVDMRRPEYVRDALGVLAWPPLPDPQAVYRSLQT